MRLIARLLLLSVIALVAATPPAYATPPPDRLAALARGVNLTNWFRFPARADDEALRTYLPDSAIAALRRAGFTFVRLAVQPELLDAVPQRLALLVQVVRRLQRAGLAVVLGPHPTTWHLEQNAADRDRLLAFWRRLAPALRPLDPRLTYPEILNEPVFADTPNAWEALQTEALAVVRTALPDATVVLTGSNWGGIDGLSALHPVTDPPVTDPPVTDPPVTDPNVIYSFHFYEPSELTALAAYRPNLDRAALARMPFPMDPAGCRAAADSTSDTATSGLIRFVCSMRWNAARVGARIAQAATWGRHNHAAVLLGEFGASQALNAPARLAWLEAVRRACEQHGIGWAIWGYDDMMGFGIDPRTPARSTMDHATLLALGLAAGP